MREKKGLKFSANSQFGTARDSFDSRGRTSKLTTQVTSPTFEKNTFTAANYSSSNDQFILILL